MTPLPVGAVKLTLTAFTVALLATYANEVGGPGSVNKVIAGLESTELPVAFAAFNVNE